MVPTPYNFLEIMEGMDKNFKDQLIWSQDITETEFGYLHFFLFHPLSLNENLISNFNLTVVPTVSVKYEVCAATEEDLVAMFMRQKP